MPYGVAFVALHIPFNLANDRSLTRYREREDIQPRCRSKFFKHKSLALTLYAHLRNRWKRSIEDGSHIIINDKSAHGTCPNSAAHQQLTLIKVCVLFRLWCAVKSFITLTGRGRNPVALSSLLPNHFWRRCAGVRA